MEGRKLRTNFFTLEDAKDRGVRMLNRTLDFLAQIPRRLQRSVEDDGEEHDMSGPALLTTEREQHINSEKKLRAWKENPSWVDQPPEINVKPKGSLCNLSARFKVGLPPDAIFDIVTDPGNKRVFKNIKEVIHRRVLVDEGLRQVVEVEQVALWRFLWWTGTISVHVYVDQNRENYTVKFKQGKSGFMKRFEGCWSLQPLFVDEELCSTDRPRNLMDYETCSGGKGRVGSFVKLEQMIQPSLVPPPPISWYLRGITARTTETMIADLLAEAARLRKVGGKRIIQEPEDRDNACVGVTWYYFDSVKERWHLRQGRRTGL